MNGSIRSTLYPPTLPNWRMCLLSLVAGAGLAWLYTSGLLLPVLGGLFALVNAIVLGVLGIVVCMFVFGKAD
jgi:hypothetical protein